MTDRTAHRPTVARVALLAVPALVASLAAGAAPAPAVPAAAPSPADCGRILERWAVDPKASLRPLVEQCKAAAAADPAASFAPAPVVADAAGLDPCAGGGQDNVLCWGPWAGIAPAAGGPPATVAVNELRSPNERPELAEDLTAGVIPPAPPPLPLGACAPGTPCGFATVVSGVTSGDTPERTEFARIELAPDGTSFIIRRLDGSVIGSVDAMGTVITPRADGYGNLRATGRDGDEQSRLVARVIQREDGTLVLAADIWGHGSRAGGPVNSGYFAWGAAASQADLDSLNAGNVSATFTGPMSVNNATTATMTIDFGARPTWSGNWVNPAWSFSAGGVVSGADIVSLPSQFSGNVVADQSLVQGAIVGEAGNRGVTHLIDVTLTGQGLVRDVGLLREVATPTVQN